MIFLPTSELDLALPNVLQNTSLKSIWLHLWTDDPRPGPISIKKGPNVDMDESILSDNWTRPRTYMLSGSNVFFFSNTVEVVYYGYELLNVSIRRVRLNSRFYLIKKIDVYFSY